MILTSISRGPSVLLNEECHLYVIVKSTQLNSDILWLIRGFLLLDLKICAIVTFVSIGCLH